MFKYAAPLFIICCWKWGDWKDWGKYYPTILYYLVINFITNFLTAHYPLWEYGGEIINHTFSDIAVSFTFFPSVVMLYIPHYPKKIWKKVIYILSWSLIFVFIEFASLRIGTFKYYNGWNLQWSMGFDVVMFIMLRLHYKRPLAAWLISAILISVILAYFRLPINNMR